MKYARHRDETVNDLLGMAQVQLAAASGVAEMSIRRFEGGLSVRQSTIARIRDALERQGIEFSNGAEPGVKLRPSKAVVPV